jgi:exodeoxyribonuclease V alpha subunit
MSPHLKRTVDERFDGYLKARNAEEGFALFDQFRILCALREGPFGAVHMNHFVENMLRDQGVIERHAKWYRGRPVMITRNDYNLRLFNGDVGMTWPDPETKELRVFFPSPDGLMRRFHPVRLPELETVFAMTVHKSQGSEFDDVLLILPDKDYPVLTKELIYTGITRARNQVALWGNEEVLRMAISRSIQRMSGLKDALWNPSMYRHG